MSNPEDDPIIRPTDRWLEPGKTNMQVIYILYLASFVIGLTGLVGIVMAYINRGKSAPWIETHYTWAIRTFWIGLLYSLVASFLMIIGVGFLLIIAVVIWVIVRCIIGLQKIGRNEPVANPESWWI
ncbi:putative membrane protein [Hoeflea marina]|uniref:Putative membrane protein n=1 Tax=Hoeflea marina TaxID=274592 RepID=A0A317PMU0_9HYPH|nr:DUF4870 domain-containing protein [Hoeflea marina]PWW01579.1 putative membrane protein [Hoeflea marina]